MQGFKWKSPGSKNCYKSECPYCKSELTETEREFHPCHCSFQACVYCYKDIINKVLCPKCKSQLKVERINNFIVTRQNEFKKLEAEKLKKKVEKRPTQTTVVTTVTTKGATRTNVIKPQPLVENSKFNFKKMSFQELSKIRVIQRNLMYVIGLAPHIAHVDTLERIDYFGQYGKILKTVVNKGNAYNAGGANGPSYSAYITYSTDIETAVAILASDQYPIHDRVIRASYGTTKYCSYYLKDQNCPNRDCLFLHHPGDDDDAFIKDENVSNKNLFNDQQKLAFDFLKKHIEDAVETVNNGIKRAPFKQTLPPLVNIKSKLDNFMKEKQSNEQSFLQQEIHSPQSTTLQRKESTNSSVSEKNEFEEQISKEIQIKPARKSKRKKTMDSPGGSKMEKSESEVPENSNTTKKDSKSKEEQEFKEVQNSEPDEIEWGQLRKNSEVISETTEDKHGKTETQESEESLNEQSSLTRSPQPDLNQKIVENLAGSIGSDTKNSRFKVAQDTKPSTSQEFNLFSQQLQDYVHSVSSEKSSTRQYSYSEKNTPVKTGYDEKWSPMMTNQSTASRSLIGEYDKLNFSKSSTWSPDNDLEGFSLGQPRKASGGVNSYNLFSGGFNFQDLLDNQTQNPPENFGTIFQGPQSSTDQNLFPTNNNNNNQNSLFFNNRQSQSEGGQFHQNFQSTPPQRTQPPTNNFQIDFTNVLKSEDV